MLTPTSILQKNLTSVLDRYSNEIKRVTQVVNAHLKKKGNGTLVGDKITYADLAFIPWFKFAEILVPDWDRKSEVPEFVAWYQGMQDRDGVKKAYANPAFQTH